MSPFGRMIHWLSWKYRVLFLVSAGTMLRASNSDVVSTRIDNCRQSTCLRRWLVPFMPTHICVGFFRPQRQSTQLRWEVFTEMTRRCCYTRNLISPYPETGYPSPLNRIGLGFKRAVKPDLFEGGLQLYRLSRNPAEPNGVLELAQTLRSGPGQLVASPGQGGELRASRYLCGTRKQCDRARQPLL